MKLHENQMRLIRHLIRFQIMRYEDCLMVLDTGNTGDMVALSYQFRPLTKHKYLGKNNEGIVTVLKKGRELFPGLHPLFYVPGRSKDKDRILQVSRMCAVMELNGIPVTDEIPEDDAPHFIPSACWRKIADGILSTTRFMGILLAYGRKYAVYDIGDGTMEWQMKAEVSLFSRKYNSYETRADGMILICDDDKRDAIAERIIRHTMWHRRRLLKAHYTETNKPVAYSHSSIMVRPQYEHVYLTTYSTLSQSLERIYDEPDRIQYYAEKWKEQNDPQLGDVENYPHRYFLNPAYDLLKLVYFFNAVTENDKYEKTYKNASYHVFYHIVMYREDIGILNMYPDLMKLEGVTVHEFSTRENCGEAQQAAGR